jgi:predicted chitinase
VCSSDLEIIPSNTNSQKSSTDGVDEAETNYVTKFLDKYNGKHGIKGNISDGGSISKCELSPDVIDLNVSVVTEYYKYQQSQNKEGGGGTVGFIPFKLGLTMDGLSGIKIYNKLHVNTRFLPSNYGKTLDLIVTGVSHELNGHDWETQIEATVIPKTTQSKGTQITIENIKEDIQAVGAAGSSEPTVKGKVPESKKNVITKIVELAKSKGIKDKERLTCILAVAGGETQWNPGKSESFSYSLPRAREVFGGRIPKNDVDALKLIPKNKGGSGTQETLANHLYGGRYHNKQNEGWKYRGRGMTQITFKSNYENVQNNLISKYFPKVGNIITDPDLVNDTDVSVAILVYGKLQAFFGDKLVEGDKAYLSNAVRVQATQNGSNGKGKRRHNSVTKNYANAIYAINNTPWVQDLIK